jgi:hypothetical protein
MAGFERKKGGRMKHKKTGGAVHRMAGGPVKAQGCTRTTCPALA